MPEWIFNETMKWHRTQPDLGCSFKGDRQSIRSLREDFNEELLLGASAIIVSKLSLKSLERIGARRALPGLLDRLLSLGSVTEMDV